MSRSIPTILLFGSTGQVGSALLERLQPMAHVVAPRRSEADFSQPASLERVIERARPTLVVNASAYTAVDRAETEPELATAVNATAPEHIARASERVGAALVHFSTDYVYDGTKGTPYVETDSPNPLGVYGRSKLAGDQAIAGSNVPYLIFRTSWVYSLQGRNFLLAIANRARETGKLRVVDDQHGAPTFAPAIADAVVEILRDRLNTPDLSKAIAADAGVYHLTASGATTWYEFARTILERMRITAEVTPITTGEFGAPAPRPRYSVLDNTKLRTSFGVRLRDWREQLGLAVNR